MSRRGLVGGGVLLACGFLLGWLWRGAAPLPNAGAAPAVGKKAAGGEAAVPPRDGKLRVIAFGAHPDDCELKAGGTAAKWAAQGHHVKFVSVTNGDIGHWRQAGGPLARRRTAEVEKAAQIL